MGGFGLEVVAYVQHYDPELEIIGYYDDIAKNINIPHLGGFQDIPKMPDDNTVVLTIGDSQLKQKLVDQLCNKKFQTLNYGNCFAKDIEIGQGSIICPGVMVTVNVKIGDFCLVNLNCTIGHNVKIADFSSIMPGANISGDVTIGKGVLIGTGAQILQGIKVGDNSKIGAGAVVTKDVEPGTTVIGVPAKRV